MRNQEQNNPPQIITSSKAIAKEGVPYFSKVDTIDLDGDNVTYQIEEGPSGIKINSNDMKNHKSC